MDTKLINTIKKLTKEEKKTVKIMYNDKTKKYNIYVLEQKKIKL